MDGLRSGGRLRLGSQRRGRLQPARPRRGAGERGRRRGRRAAHRHLPRQRAHRLPRLWTRRPRRGAGARLGERRQLLERPAAGSRVALHRGGAEPRRPRGLRRQPRRLVDRQLCAGRRGGGATDPQPTPGAGRALHGSCGIAGGNPADRYARDRRDRGRGAALGRAATAQPVRDRAAHRTVSRRLRGRDAQAGGRLAVHPRRESATGAEGGLRHVTRASRDRRGEHALAPVAINSDLLPTDAARIRKSLPDFTLDVLEHSGHFLMLEAPARFNPLLLKDLDALSARAAH